ncbi:MAG: DUF2807 domain-containing protein [Muribaculaceae bacterium]|nr:DUF2807 domain-containing protein [Muribaculaceae bacterium]
MIPTVKRQFLSFIAFAAITFFAAYAEDVTYRLKIENFTELTVVDGVNVDCYCRPDSAGWAVFSSDPEYASCITFNNNASRMTVQTTADERPISGMPRITLYCTGLTKIENSGDSLLRVYCETVHAESLKAVQIGNGRMEIKNISSGNLDAGVAAGKGSLSIEGKTDKAKIRNVGTGFIDASGLEVGEVSCFIFGTGDIACTPSEKLKVYGAGSGRVLYTEEPKKVTNRSIGVKTKLDREESETTKNDVLTATK